MAWPVFFHIIFSFLKTYIYHLVSNVTNYLELNALIFEFTHIKKELRSHHRFKKKKKKPSDQQIDTVIKNIYKPQHY